MEEARKSSIGHRQEKRAAKRKQETEKVAAIATTPAPPLCSQTVPSDHSTSITSLPGKPCMLMSFCSSLCAYLCAY